MENNLNHNKEKQNNIRLYDFIFNHEDFYDMKLSSKYLFCVMMYYRDLSNDESISIPQELLAEKLHTTVRSITTIKKELKNYKLIEDEFVGIGELTKITINQSKINQYKDDNGTFTFKILPKNIYDSEELSIASKVLYAYLLYRFNENQSNSISMSNDQIKALLNVSLSKARKTKKELVDIELITEKRRGHARANTIFKND